MHSSVVFTWAHLTPQIRGHTYFHFVDESTSIINTSSLTLSLSHTLSSSSLSLEPIQEQKGGGEDLEIMPNKKTMDINTYEARRAGD
jgi:hypothetical protein